MFSTDATILGLTTVHVSNNVTFSNILNLQLVETVDSKPVDTQLTVMTTCSFCDM